MKIPWHDPLNPQIPQHQTYDRSPDRLADQKFYGGSLWKGVRRYHLALNPLCVECGYPANTVDHVVERLSLPRTEWYEPSNLQSLCRSCHGKKRGHAGKSPIH